jgi:hypothetical protein
MTILEDIKIAAAGLTALELLELIEFLEESSQFDTESVHKQWSELAQHRLAMHKSGVRKSVPFDTVFS